MENIGGALAYKATLDIDDFKVSSEAMERYIRNASNNAIAETGRMEQSLLNFAQNGAKYIASYLVGQGMMSLVRSIVQVRGQFQQLELAFDTMLRSTEKSDQLMQQLVDTAAKTPFDLTSIAQSAKQMLAYGSNVENVVDELVMLGNVASGVGSSLGEIAYLYGTLRSQGRAYTVDIRQFAGRGVPIYEELGKVLNADRQELNKLVTEGKVGFPEVEKAFKNMTSEGGIYFNLMQNQSKSLTGMLSNLGDAWDNALNKIGTENQDLFSGAIQGATTLVENLDEVIRVIGSVALAYGSYKAAIVANTLATKGYTGVALIDNTVRQAKTALLKAEERMTWKTAAQIKAMTAAQEAHVAALQKELSAEEQANMAKKLRIAAIQQLLTAQQQEYLSNLNLTASSANYEAVATSVLTVEQREALSKTDLSAKSAVYRAALEKEVAAKLKVNAATLESMRTEVKAAAQKVEAAKQTAISSMQAAETARYELNAARQSGDATRIATAEKKLEAAQDKQSAARKAALAAQSKFYAKKKQLETMAVRQSTAASIADTTAKRTQGIVTAALTTITNKATLALKTLWASMKTNPIGWVISLVGMLVSAFMLFKKSEEDTTDAMGEFQDTTKKQIDNLNLLFSILRDTEKGTKTHGDALKKVNDICKDFNKTLLDENATLDEQARKYNELTTAIQENTAEKIKAKYAEQAFQEMADRQTEALEDLKKAAGKASYKDTKLTPTVMPEGTTINTYKVVDVNSNNIRKATEAVWDMVESMATDATNRLKGLTGKAYTEMFDTILEDIVRKVAVATGATNKEIGAFEGEIRKYLTGFIEASMEAQEEIGKVEKQMKAFSTEDTTPLEKSVDYISMSFEDLDKRIRETQDQIDSLNGKEIKVEADETELQGLEKLMAELTDARDTKTANLNTESGINDRIKQLKEERSNVEINSAKYQELTDTINGLENKLPKNIARQDNNEDPLRNKQLETDRQLEEARISIMEEGYEKRKAALDLQHKENLDRIDREERELEKARKAAGKGGLTATEQEGFDERRSIENTSYQKEQNRLFDGEIAYKKQQYELYFRWVRNLGEDVANKQFSDLLKGGASFKQYLENQIAEMNQKKQAGTLTEGEENHLIGLNIQYDEIIGAKSAMDLFKESVTESIGVATTLAERVQAIAEAKERLANGSTGLVGEDEKAEANLFVSEKQAEIEKEIQETILSNYKSYEEQRKAIQEEYAMLREQNIAKNNEDILKRLNEGENEALSALNASFLMQSESWKNLFSDLDSLTVEQIDKLIRDIEEQMNAGNLDLNPADLSAVLDKLDEAKQKILDVNPFKAMGNAIQDIFTKAKDGSKKSTDQIKREWSNLAKATDGAFDFVNDAIDSCSILGDLLGETGKATISVVQGIATSAIAMASAIQTAERGSIILAAISMALQVINLIASAFDKDAELEKKIENIQEDIDELTRSYDRLQRATENTYWAYAAEDRKAHKKRITALQEEIDYWEEYKDMMNEKVSDSMRGPGKFDEKSAKEYMKALTELSRLKKELENATSNADMFELYELQKQNLEEQKKLIDEQIDAEIEKKDPDEDTIQEWEDQKEQIDNELEDLDKKMVETLAGTDVKSAIDEFADALVNAYCQGEDAAKALGEVTKNTLKNAVVEALKRQFLAKGIEDAVNGLAEDMEDGILSEKERKEFEERVNAAGEAFNSALEGVGDWIKDAEEAEDTDPLTGAVTSMSEETGGVIAGRLNAFIINQGDQLAIMKQNILYQAQIAQNTKTSANELAEIKATLKRIENKDNSLLSQGIA